MNHAERRDREQQQQQLLQTRRSCNDFSVVLLSHGGHAWLGNGISADLVSDDTVGIILLNVHRNEIVY